MANSNQQPVVHPPTLHELAKQAITECKATSALLAPVLMFFRDSAGDLPLWRLRDLLRDKRWDSLSNPYSGGSALPHTLVAALRSTPPTSLSLQESNLRNLGAHVFRVSQTVSRLTEGLGAVTYRNPQSRALLPAPQPLWVELGFRLNIHAGKLRERVRDIDAQARGYSDQTRRYAARVEQERNDPGQRVLDAAQLQLATMLELNESLDAIVADCRLVLQTPELDFALPSSIGQAIALLQAAGIPAAATYLLDMDKRFHQADWRGACDEARKALEQAVIDLAKLRGWTASPPDFRNACIFLVSRGLPEDISNSISVPDIGLYGLLSIKGGHAQARTHGRGTEANTDAEAAYCIRWLLATIDLLISCT